MWGELHIRMRMEIAIPIPVFCLEEQHATPESSTWIENLATFSPLAESVTYLFSIDRRMDSL